MELLREENSHYYLRKKYRYGICVDGTGASLRFTGLGKCRPGLAAGCTRMTYCLHTTYRLARTVRTQVFLIILHKLQQNYTL